MVAASVVSIMHGTNDTAPRQVGTYGVEPRPDSIFGVVLSRQDHGRSALRACAIDWKPTARRDDTNDGECQLRFAEAGMVNEHGHLAAGDAARPEPAHRPRFDVGNASKARP